jgi:bilirubin oxidase
LYRLALAGHTFVHVGSDGGLFEKPVEVKEILIANSERVELLVRGTGAPGSRVALQALPYDRYAPPTRRRTGTRRAICSRLQYSNDAPTAPVAIPDRLRPVAALDPRKGDGDPRDHVRPGPDQRPHDGHGARRYRAVWRDGDLDIENLVAMDHPFPPARFQFQVLDRNGVPSRS